MRRSHHVRRGVKAPGLGARRRRLKVLHLMTWLAPGGGVDQNVHLTIRSLSPRYEHHLCVGREMHEGPLASDPQVHLRVCPYMERAIRPLKDLRAFCWIYRLIRRERYDIVHTHETKASLLGRVAARVAGCPFVIYGLHGVVFNDPVSTLVRKLYICLEVLTVRSADLIVSVSRDALRHYHRARIGRRIPWRVVYSGVDVQRFDLGEGRAEARRRIRDSLGLPQDAVVIVTVGRFSLAKAQRFTIDAFARLRRSDAWLLLVGEGPEREVCERQAGDLGLSRRVRFLGFREDIPHCFAAADVHLLTSLREGLPRVVVEAALCRVPSVCFEVEGVREIVTHAESGFVVPSGDVEALVRCTERLLQDEDLRKQMGERARAHAIRHWDYRRMAEALDTIYGETGHVG